MANEKVTKQDE